MKKKIIIGVIIILVIAAGTIAYLSQANQPIDVDGSAAMISEIKKVVEETGTVESKNQRVITANTSGEIESVKYEVGDTVEVGDVLIRFDLDVAELNILSTRSKLNGLYPLYTQAKRNTVNSKSLYEEGAISYEEYQTAVTTEKQLAAQISELNYAIKQLVEMKNFGVVKSPINGVVIEIYVKEGENVVNGMNLIEIADVQNIFVEVDLLIDDASLIKDNAQVIVINEDIGLILQEGNHISKIHPKAHMKISDLGIEQKRVTVEITISDTSKLKLGYDVDVEIVVEAKENAIIIPENAMFELDGKKYVLVVENEIAVLREIMTGIENSDHIEVVSGLAEGEIVIESPDESLEAGKRVIVIE